MKAAYLCAMLLMVAFSAHAQTPGEIASARLAAATYLSPKFRSIFLADQNERNGPGPIDMNAVEISDQAREVQVRQLLANGAAVTGSDYEACAWVFQHSNAKDAQLLSHTLALAALAKGDAAASWIAAASLDRYLGRIGKPQVFGTQYSRAKGEPWSQGPYDRTLLNDSVRRAVGVEDQVGQAERLKGLNTK